MRFSNFLILRFSSCFYNNNGCYRVSLDEVYIGQMVAAQYTDSFWYRGKITAFHSGRIEIFYLDYGSTCIVNLDQVSHLHVQFTKLPIQAMRSRLYGVAPTWDNMVWSVEDCQQFFDLVKGIQTTWCKQIGSLFYDYYCVIRY